MGVPVETSSQPVVLVIDETHGPYSTDFLEGITNQEIKKLATSVEYHIDNKYYEEDVDFRICHSPKDISDQTFDRMEGIIILHHKLNPSRLQPLWLPWALKIGDDMPELALCVSLEPPLEDGHDDNSTEDKAPFDVDEWCMETGFEYVSVLPGETLRSDAGQSRLTDEDMCGSDRIVEALHCTMWSTMRMKGSGTTGTDPTTRDSRSDIATEDTAAEYKHTADTDTIQPADEAEMTIAESRASANIDADLAAFLTPDEMKFMEGGFFGDESSVDDPMDNLEKSFMLMNSLKGTVTTQGSMRANQYKHMQVEFRPEEKVSTLPMEQRHVVAERVAMAFYHAMEGGDSEDDQADLRLSQS